MGMHGLQSSDVAAFQAPMLAVPTRPMKSPWRETLANKGKPEIETRFEVVVCPDLADLQDPRVV